ncbi:leucine-rich repeat extensin-like protein 5 [Mirounga leonina]|uniref:leucine-rich repeat extensin-like protein 5 n=1 Tax=Mirounga leonina TaxID=9715 RepID=UPI00156C273C|nr:leucine-rich repeat extensin-like protein 5 [Mirounga leonina]
MAGPGRIWGLQGPLSRSQVWQPGSSRRGRRENPERLRAGHPSSPSLFCGWPSHDSAPSRSSASPAKRGPSPAERPRTQRQARTPQGQERSLGGQSRGSAPADPGVSRLRLRPWPLSPAPARVFHATVWLGEAGDVLGAPGAGCGHKSPCGTSFPPLTRGCSRPAPRPGLHRAPRSPSHSLGSLRLPGESSQELPCSPKRATDSPIQCHHLPSPRSPGPQAAWASPDPGLGDTRDFSPPSPTSAPPSATGFGANSRTIGKAGIGGSIVAAWLEISFDANWSLLRTSFNSPLTWVPWCPFDGQETPGEVTSSHSSEVAANTLNEARQGGTNVEPQHPWEPPA